MARRRPASGLASPVAREALALIFDIVNEWVPADAFAAEPARIGNVRPRLRDPSRIRSQPRIFSWVFPTRYFPRTLCRGLIEARSKPLPVASRPARIFPGLCAGDSLKHETPQGVELIFRPHFPRTLCRGLIEALRRGLVTTMPSIDFPRTLC